MRTRSFVVRTIARHQPLHARFVEHDHVIETFTPSRSNKSLDERIVPRRVWRREHVVNPHGLRGGPQAVERVIAIVNQVSREAPRPTETPRAADEPSTPPSDA